MKFLVNQKQITDVPHVVCIYESLRIKNITVTWMGRTKTSRVSWKADEQFCLRVVDHLLDEIKLSYGIPKGIV